MCGRNFLCEQLSKRGCYLYENTAPVAVIFLQEGNDIVSANGTFMFGEEFINLTEESISELFEGLYETIKKVER